MNRQSGVAVGMAIGLMIGLILVVVLLKFANKDKKVITEYDERQKEIRNKGYMIAFYTLVALLGIESIWSVTDIGFPLPDHVMYFADIIIGVTVMCAYSIWKGVYWGLNNNIKRYGIIMVIALVINALPVIGAFARGGMDFSDPVSSLPMYNLFVLVMFAVLGIELLVKKLVDKADSGEED